MSDDRRFDEERPTSVPCPACAGTGFVVEELATGHRGRICGCCDGLKVVTVERMREWKIAHSPQIRFTK